MWKDNWLLRASDILKLEIYKEVWIDKKEKTKEIAKKEKIGKKYKGKIKKNKKEKEAISKELENKRNSKYFKSLSKEVLK